MSQRFTPQDFFEDGRKMAEGMPTELSKRFESQMNQMNENAIKWRAANPNREARVQFNFPPKVGLIAAISDAVEQKFVVTNEAGLELIKAMWPWGRNDEPTVNMVRVILENE